MSNEINVKTDYDAGTSSTTTDVSGILSERTPGQPGKGGLSSISMDVHVDTIREPFPKLEKYGTGKPKRIIIRANIAHDSKNQS